MKICFVTGSYPPVRCGVGDYVASLTQELARGHEVHVVTSSYLDIPAADGRLRVHPVVQNWSGLHTARIARFLSDLKADVIHFQYPTSEYKRSLSTNLLPAALKHLSRTAKVFETLHESIHPLTFRGRLRILANLAFADGVVIVDPEYSEKMPPIHQWATRKALIRFIPVAASIPRVVVTQEDVTFYRQRFSVGQANLLVYFGFINPAKGIEDALLVCDRLHAKLVIVSGLDANNSYHRRLQDIIVRSGLTERVSIIGFQEPEEVARILATADACIFPFVEGVSPKNTSFLAALAQGTLTVTTSRKASGYDELQNVYYTRPHDTEAMASAIRQYGGRKTASPRVPQWAEVAALHLDLYNDVTK